MTNQPIREDLWHAADHAATTAHLEGKDKEECVHAGIKVALSILSTALAERDERIAELEGALKPFGNIAGRWSDNFPDDTEFTSRPINGHEGGFAFEHDFTMGDLRHAAAKLKESSRG